MKRLYRYIFLLVTLTVAAACADKLSDESLEGRDTTKLSVTYSLAGSEVKSVNVGHTSVKKVLDVKVNSEGLKWDLESNRDWCVVVPEDHQGSGTVTLDIAANESFEEREPATLTFVAGDYRGFQITVTQNGSSFIIGQPYYVSGLNGGTYTVNVTTLSGTEWEYSAESWIDVVKGTPADNGDYTTTPVTFTVEANDSASRYGALTLSAGATKDNVWIYQFGSDVEYDDQGNIFLSGEGEESLTLIAPSYVVRDVKAPAFAETSVVENDNGTATVTLNVTENLSDCSEGRSVEVSLLLSNESSSIVALPAIMQDYIPADGLVTANGVVAFAKAVAAGTSTADWEEDGVVTVKADIDMSEVADWAGIGTAQTPFKGQFNGNGHVITNLRNTSVGLFGYCEGAKISDITLGKGCNLYFDGDYVGNAGSLGGIVAVAKETSVSGCEVLASIDFAGANDNDEPAYVGGLVGYADEKTTVTKSKMSGNITISTGSVQMECYVGGVVGYSEGTVTNNEMSGKINSTSSITDIVAGGVTSVLSEKTIVSNNSFMGSITLGGASKNVILGGLYGRVDSDNMFDVASDKSVTQGEIKVDSYFSNAETELYVGGFVGKAGEKVALSFKGYECNTSIAFDQTVSRYSSYICLGGVLGGCNYDNAKKATSISFENVTNYGQLSNAYARVITYVSRGFFGGLAGLVNAEDTKFISCVNTAPVGKIVSGDRGENKAGYIMIVGGLAGVVLGGDAEFTKCENKGPVTNVHYSNHAPENSKGSADTSSGWLSACTSAGILGTFDNKVTSESKSLKITSCVNSGNIIAYRGCGAGIVGFARNAEITSCTNSGDLSFATNSNASHKAGIASWVENTKIDNCVAKCKIEASNGASAPMTPGGILSLAYKGNVTVSNCSYFGEATYNSSATTARSCGGLVGKVNSGVTFTMSDCKFGGKVEGLAISANNVVDYAVGSGAVVDSGAVKYWDGNL